MSITEIAVKRPLLITVIFTVLILFGIACYLNLNYNLLPKFDLNTVTVTTTYRGASASEVELNVTKPLEESLSALEGLDKVSAVSMQNTSVLTLELRADANVDKALRDVESKIDQSLSLLPVNADKPRARKVSPENAPVLRISAASVLTDAALFDLIDQKIRPQLENVSGVGQVNIIGGNAPEIQVNIDADKLAAYQMNISEVVRALQVANQSFPAGQVQTTKKQYSIRFDARVNNVNQLSSFIVKTNAAGGKVYLRDIADVVYGYSDALTINHLNGQPAVGILVVKQSDANSVMVSKQIKAKLKLLQSQYKAQNLTFTVTGDQSTYTLAAADAVMHDLVIAILIVAVVMLLFLHSVRSSLFVLVALPSSMLPTFIAMYLFGFSLNILTLMALSLVVGILVDDSIVVLENIYRHMEMGKDRRKAALDGRSEIGFTAVAITLVDVVVFFPLSFTGGLIGSILREFSLVVVISTLLSLFVSFTLTPLLASRFGKIEVLNKNSWWGKLNFYFENFLENCKDGYGKLLAWSLGKKRWLFGLVLLLFAFTGMLFKWGFIGFTFIQNGDRGQLTVNMELAPSVSLYQTNLTVQNAEKMLLSHKEVLNVFSNVGYSSRGNTGGLDGNNNEAELNVTLVDKENRTVSSEEFGSEIRKEISRIPGVKVKIATVGLVGNTEDAPIQIVIKGADRESVRQAANIVKNVAEQVPGTQSVEFSVKDPKPEIEVTLEREKLNIFGLDAAQAGLAVQNAYRGDNDSKFRYNGNEYKIFIGLDKEDKGSLNDVSKLSLTGNKGELINLSQLAQIHEVLGESVLERTDRLPSITVKAAVVGRPVGTVGNEIKQLLAGKKLPVGIVVDFAGDVKNQSDANKSLTIALTTGVILIYLIMVALYESLIYPLVVLFSIPVAVIGAFLALALSMQSASIFAIVGLIMLLGLVSKNAILIVDFTNKLRDEGYPVRDAIIAAGKERLRPILMTTIAMITGMLPIALSGSAGAEIKNGMAWVIIGGLSSSLTLTLFVVPAVYLIVEQLRDKFAKGKNNTNTVAVTPKEAITPEASLA